jgi:beta-lactamase regulating signal transducer with metallopeptidase domain
MNPLVSPESLALWLADYYLLASVLLFAAIACSLFMKQPAQRLAITKATIAALFLLAILCAIPGWSLVHLFTSEQPQAIGSQAELVEIPLGHDLQTLPAGEFIGVEPPVTATPPIENNPPATTTAPSTNWRELPWAWIIVAAHATGSALVIAWLVLGAIAAYRLQRSAEYAPAELNALLAEVAALQHVSSRLPDLKISPRIDVAVALGIFRPTVLLPTDWLKTNAPEQHRTVLAHELAHVANRDLRWLAASRALVMLLWAQPFLWHLRRRMRLDQEALADAAAAELTSRQRYAEQLVAWARHVPARPAVHLSAAIGLWEGPSQLRQRITLLLNHRVTVLRDCSRGWKRSVSIAMVTATLILSLATIETGQTQPPAGDEKQLSELESETVAAAINVLRETEGTGDQAVGLMHVADNWAIAIQTLADVGKPAVPHIIKALDEEQRDHAISKLAFALRAIGDPRAVPALIRTVPRTLFPSRSDYGLRIEDPDLLLFMQKHDLSSSDRDKDSFDYGRAFREVTGALHKLTGADQNDVELNWVHLGETETQRTLQRKLFHDLAQRWANWWSNNWQGFDVDEQYAHANLPPISDPLESPVPRSLPVGPGLGLVSKYSGWIVQSAHESTRRCFVDLDTSRETGWPSALPPVGQLGTNSQVLAWARSQGFDMLGVTYQPPGYDAPMYCLQPLDMKVWQITPEQQRDLPRAIKGEIPYPIEKPVDRLVPRKEPYEGVNKQQLGGTAFLFLTTEGTAGLLRMTAQVTDTNVQFGRPASPDDQYSPTGFYRGVKISFAIIAETDKPLRFDIEPPVGARLTMGPRPLPAVPSDSKVNVQPVEIPIIVARHVLLHDGKIIEWAELEKMIAALPNPRLAHPVFKFTSGGAAEKQEDIRAKIWELRRRVTMHGHTWASVSPEESARYDAMQPASDQPHEGPTFRALVLDSETNEPAAGIRLFKSQQPGQPRIEGVSDDNGILLIENMTPGEVEFDVSAVDEQQHELAGQYARWWSPDAIHDHERQLENDNSGIQRNFDSLTFNVLGNTVPIKIFVEKAVSIRGRVIDPDGNPVAGATVAPALTGSGNSITGDTRYSVRTAADGTFHIRLPASKTSEYNLVAHDGGYREWRRWANGVGEMLTTQPGKELTGIELRLTRPGVVRGKVVDGDGNAVPNHRVRTHAVDKLENRYYDPETRTDENGQFELKIVRHGEHFVQADPFWLRDERADGEASKRITVKAGETVEGIVLVHRAAEAKPPIDHILPDVAIPLRVQD